MSANWQVLPGDVRWVGGVHDALLGRKSSSSIAHYIRPNDRQRDRDVLKTTVCVRELLKAEDSVGAGRQRIREEQGWAAFKRERDRGYEDSRLVS